MADLLATQANEGGTYVVNCAFADEDGDAVTPQSLTWTLTDDVGNVINGREDVVVSSLAASVDVVLSGDDLAITEGYSEVTRVFTVEGTYNSDLGNGLPIKDAIEFSVENLVAVT